MEAQVFCLDCGQPGPSGQSCQQCGAPMDVERTAVTSLESRYVFGKQLGRGSFGQVLECQPTRGGAVRAAKVFRFDSHQHEAEVRKSFFKELTALSKIQHPHIVRFVEVGIVEGKHACIIMEKVETTLRNHPVQGLSRALQVAVELAQALEYLHSHGIIFRDLSPGNIGLDATGEVKLLDFGATRFLSDHLPSTLGTMMNVGTPGFEAPEQLEESSEKVNRCTDIHNLGAVLYWMITGKAAINVGPDALRVAKQMAATEPAPPLPPDPNRPDELDFLVMACLARKTYQRPQEMRAVRARLEEISTMVQLGKGRIDQERKALETKVWEFRELETKIADKEHQLTELEKTLDRRAQDLAAREAQLNQREKQESLFPGAAGENGWFAEPPTEATQTRRKLRVVTFGLLALVVGLGAGFGASDYIQPASPKIQAPAMAVGEKKGAETSLGPAEGPTAEEFLRVDAGQGPEKNAEETKAAEVIQNTGELEENSEVGAVEPPWEKYRRDGIQLSRENKWEPAQAALFGCIRQKGHPAECYRWLGLTQKNLRRCDLAVSSFNNYLERAPQAKDAAVVRALRDECIAPEYAATLQVTVLDAMFVPQTGCIVQVDGKEMVARTGAQPTAYLVVLKAPEVHLTISARCPNGAAGRTIQVKAWATQKIQLIL